MGQLTHIINNLEFARLDRMTDIGERGVTIWSVDGMPVELMGDLDQWAIDLGQRAAAYRAPAGESPRQ